MLLFRYIIAASILISLPAFSGTRDGAGGNSILCKDGKLYSWDYVQTQGTNQYFDAKILKAKSTDEILRLITHRLRKVNPFLGISFQTFSRLNEDPFSRDRRLWIGGVNPLPKISREKARRVPVSCIGNMSPDEIKKRIRQGVIRKAMPSRRSDFLSLRYEYDQQVFQQLEQNHPMQLSFLLVHEWLRDFTHSEEEIAYLTKMLHSRYFKNTYAHSFYYGLQRALNFSFPTILAGSYGIESPSAYKGSIFQKTNFTLKQNGSKRAILFNEHIFSRKINQNYTLQVKLGSFKSDLNIVADSYFDPKSELVRDEIWFMGTSRKGTVRVIENKKVIYEKVQDVVFTLRPTWKKVASPVNSSISNFNQEGLVAISQSPKLSQIFSQIRECLNASGTFDECQGIQFSYR